MNTRSAIAALILAACGDGRDGTSELDSEVAEGVTETSETTTETAPDVIRPEVTLEVVDFTPLEPPPALTRGDRFELRGAMFTGPTLVLEDTPGRPWLVPIMAQADEVTVTRGDEVTVLLPAADERDRLALVAVGNDGRPGAATTIGAFDFIYGHVDVTRCGDALWVTYREDISAHVARVALQADGDGWSLGPVETIDFAVTDGAPANNGYGVHFMDVPLCTDSGRVALAVYTFNVTADVMLGTQTIGAIGDVHESRVHMLDLDAALRTGTLDGMWVAPDSGLRAVGRDDTVLMSEVWVAGRDAYDQEVLEHAFYRWDFATQRRVSVFDHTFTAWPVALLESDAGTVIICGIGGERDAFGNGFAAPDPGAPYCVGVADGQARWLVSLPSSVAPEALLIDGVLWLTTATLVTVDDAATAFQGRLVGLDPDTGAAIAHASLAIEPGSVPAGQPRRLVGEGACAGISGVGALFVSEANERGIRRYDRVIASADGSACSEPVGFFTGAPFEGYTDFRLTLAAPARGPCATSPHLALQDRSMSTPTSSWVTTGAADCTIGVAP